MGPRRLNRGRTTKSNSSSDAATPSRGGNKGGRRKSPTAKKSVEEDEDEEMMDRNDHTLLHNHEAAATKREDTKDDDDDVAAEPGDTAGLSEEKHVLSPEQAKQFDDLALNNELEVVDDLENDLLALPLQEQQQQQEEEESKPVPKRRKAGKARTKATTPKAFKAAAASTRKASSSSSSKTTTAATPTAASKSKKGGGAAAKRIQNLSEAQRLQAQKILKAGIHDAKEDFDNQMNDTLNQIPASVKSRFGEIVFAKWSRDVLPALISNPYHAPPGDPRMSWFTMFDKMRENHRPLEKMSYLVYWYGESNENNHWSIVAHTQVTPFEKAPAKMLKKFKDNLARAEKKEANGSKLQGNDLYLTRAWKEMQEDFAKEPSERRRGMPFLECYERLTLDEAIEVMDNRGDSDDDDDDDDDDDSHDDEKDDENESEAPVIEKVVVPIDDKDDGGEEEEEEPESEAEDEEFELDQKPKKSQRGASSKKKTSAKASASGKKASVSKKASKDLSKSDVDDEDVGNAKQKRKTQKGKAGERKRARRGSTEPNEESEESVPQAASSEQGGETEIAEHEEIPEMSKEIPKRPKKKARTTQSGDPVDEGEEPAMSKKFVSEGKVKGKKKRNQRVQVDEGDVAEAPPPTDGPSEGEEKGKKRPKRARRDQGDENSASEEPSPTDELPPVKMKGKKKRGRRDQQQGDEGVQVEEPTSKDEEEPISRVKGRKKKKQKLADEEAPHVDNEEVEEPVKQKMPKKKRGKGKSSTRWESEEQVAVKIDPPKEEEVADGKEPSEEGEVADEKEPSEEGEVADEKEPPGEGELVDEKEPSGEGEVVDEKEPSEEGEVVDEKEPSEAGEVANEKESSEEGEVANEKVKAEEESEEEHAEEESESGRARFQKNAKQNSKLLRKWRKALDSSDEALLNSCIEKAASVTGSFCEAFLRLYVAPLMSQSKRVLNEKSSWNKARMLFKDQLKMEKKVVEDVADLVDESIVRGAPEEIKIELPAQSSPMVSEEHGGKRSIPNTTKSQTDVPTRDDDSSAKDKAKLSSEPSTPTKTEGKGKSSVPRKDNKKKFNLGNFMGRESKTGPKSPTAPAPSLKREPSGGRQWFAKPSTIKPPTDEQRLFGLEFFRQMSLEFPPSKVDKEAVALVLEHEVFEWASRIASSEEDKNNYYWNRLHLVVAAICGKHQPGPLMRLVANGDVESAKQLVSLSDDKLNASFLGNPIEL